VRVSASTRRGDILVLGPGAKWSSPVRLFYVLLTYISEKDDAMQLCPVLSDVS
jgi:hypothetical protein